MPTLSLDAIQQRIVQRDAELQALRRELEARRSRLQSLTQRKQELQAKLQELEAEIAAVTAGARRSVAGSSKPVKKTAAKQPASKPSPPTLANRIVGIVQGAGRALTVQQITAAVKQRGFPSKSKALHKLVGKNVYGLATKGLLRRTDDYPAAFAVPSASGRSASAGVAKPAKAALKGATRPASGLYAGAPMPLKQLLEQILQKSAKPMTGSELAAAALRAGYKTKSKRLVDAVWTALGNMKNVENVKGQGYRLKKSK